MGPRDQGTTGPWATKSEAGATKPVSKRYRGPLQTSCLGKNKKRLQTKSKKVCPQAAMISVMTRRGEAWVGSVINKHNPSNKSGVGACTSSKSYHGYPCKTCPSKQNCLGPFAVSLYRCLCQDAVAVSQAPSPESNPNSPSPVITMVSHYLTIDSW